MHTTTRKYPRSFSGLLLAPQQNYCINHHLPLLQVTQKRKSLSTSKTITHHIMVDFKPSCRGIASTSKKTSSRGCSLLFGEQVVASSSLATMTRVKKQRREKNRNRGRRRGLKAWTWVLPWRRWIEGWRCIDSRLEMCPPPAGDGGVLAILLCAAGERCMDIRFCEGRATRSWGVLFSGSIFSLSDPTRHHD